MKPYAIVFAGAAALATATSLQAQQAAEPLTRALQTAAAAKWNQPQEPQRIYGETYYVGVAGLSSVLIHTDAGSILIDGDLPQSAPLIETNIRKLGFKVEDIRFILNSHTHIDHAGGIAALQRDSGAPAVTSPAGAKALRAGHVSADDPQAAFAEMAAFPAVAKVREVRDGEVLRLGKTAVTAHFTPGHTPGGMSWTWDSCEGGKCLHVAYLDSLNPVAAPNFRYTGDAQHADRTTQFRKSIQSVGALPCDILVTVHPDVADIPRKLAEIAAHPAANPFVDAQACRTLARDSEAKLDARIAEEKKTSPGR